MRIKRLFLLLVIVFGLLLARLFQLTVVEGKKYHELSEGQRIRERVIRAPRGLIIDRNGEVLARNKPIYKAPKFQNSKTPNKSQIQNSPPRLARSSGEAGKSQTNFQEEWDVISHEEALKIEARGGSEAASLKTELVREYVGGKDLAHVIGYTGEATEEEVQGSRFKVRGYELGDVVGRMGIEEQYDEILRGVDGKELIETNALGEPLQVLGKIDPQPGQDLVLNIDYALQKKAVQSMEEKKGAVVVSDPKNGEILALFSSPSFDPGMFVESREGEDGIEGVLKDEDQPLFNRVIGGLYPPGSVFKIITAAAGLEEGVIDKKTEIEDVGMIQIGPYQFGNWFFTQHGKKEGLVTIVKALKRSNDIFFYKMGEMVGVEKLAEWGKKFGIGRISGIDLPGEEEGVMPDPEWRERVKKDKWFLGDTYHLAIGQGDLLTTPLQVNTWAASIANGGKLCRPRIIKEASNEKALRSERIFSSSRIVHKFTSCEQRKNCSSPRFLNIGISKALAQESSCQDIGLKNETISLIREGMKQACEPEGTGWPLFNFKVGEKEIVTGCKTGTAEFGDPEDKTHAWFTVFAPFKDPEIMITVLVEEGGEGSYVAAPIAKEILEEYFKEENNE